MRQAPGGLLGAFAGVENGDCSIRASDERQQAWLDRVELEHVVEGAVDNRSQLVVQQLFSRLGGVGEGHAGRVWAVSLA
jgi:hypothetical protein